MLRLVLLTLDFFASFSWSTGTLDPDGQPKPAGDVHGNLDPDG